MTASLHPLFSIPFSVYPFGNPKCSRYYLLVILPLILAANTGFDANGKTVTYYPSSPTLAYNPRPLFLYHDTRIINLAFKLRNIPLGRKQAIKTAFLRTQRNFMSNLLQSFQKTNENIHQLNSLPGFSHLIQCHSYLQNYYNSQIQLPPRMICPHAYRPGLLECKRRALKRGSNISPNERIWLKTTRSKRSAWACHAGALGLIRSIYSASGG